MRPRHRSGYYANAKCPTHSAWRRFSFGKMLLHCFSIFSLHFPPVIRLVFSLFQPSSFIAFNGGNASSVLLRDVSYLVIFFYPTVFLALSLSVRLSETLRPTIGCMLSFLVSVLIPYL